MIHRLLIVATALLAGIPAFGGSAFLQHSEPQLGNLRPEADVDQRMRRISEARETVQLEAKYASLIREAASQLAQISSPEGFRRLFEKFDAAVTEGEKERVQAFGRGVDLSGLTFEEKDVARAQYARHRLKVTGGAAALSPTLAGVGESTVESLLGTGGNAASATSSSTRAIRGFRPLSRP